MKRIFATSLAAICLGLGAMAQESTLYRQFQEPEQTARPRVWWHWMNGNISKDGICKDLHWMKDAGIVGFHNFDANLATPQLVEKRIPYMTPEWKDAFRYALDVADSLGMEVTIASSPGWSETGGPWVREEDGMKKLVWRTVDVSAGEKSVAIPEGFDVTGRFQDNSDKAWETDDVRHFYRDIAVVAVRLSDAELDFGALAPTVRTSDSEASPTYAGLNSDSVTGGTTIKAGSDHSCWVEYSFETPQTIRSVVVTAEKLAGSVYNLDMQLLVSEDGKNFSGPLTLGYQATMQKTYAFAPVTGRTFRLLLTDKDKLADCSMAVHQFILSSTTRIQDAGDKAGNAFYRLLPYETTPSDGVEARLEDVVDLTGRMHDGILDWTVPAGHWKIFRFGYSLTGKTNHPASPEATGLEVDKMDPDAIKEYYRNYLQTYIDASDGRMGPEGISHLLTDSYEAGAQTWTGRMFDEFKARKGYDLLPWLPALTGLVLDSTDETERFLLDWRTCLGEMISEYSYDLLEEILESYGMKRWSESHENYKAYLADGMDCKRSADIPMSAMWMQYNQKAIFTPRFEADIRESASVAHIYGQNIAAAESFTSDGPRDGAFVYTPANLKPTADAAMASGLNRFVIHCSAHQSTDDVAPGLGLGKYGQWFNRNETWADQARAWTDYLSRSSQLLQAGQNVADIAVFYGEDNNPTGIFLKKGPEIPQGYAYDYFNRTVLVEHSHVEDGRIVVPSGASYRVLYIDSNVRYASIGVMRRIRELADAGVIICGAIPLARAGREGSDEEFQTLVNDIWKSGRSNVTEGKLAKVLPSSGITPDCALTPSARWLDTAGGYALRYVHRHLDNGDIYWITNLSDYAVSETVDMRTSGQVPQLWRAEDGSREPVSYTMAGGRTRVPLTLRAHESVFLVFEGDRVAEGASSLKQTCEKEVLRISSPWKVEFQKGRGAPESIVLDTLKSLSESSIDGVRYFSGIATYSSSFRLGGKHGRLILDLGSVKDLAEVTVNGRNLGTVWHAPYRVDITDAVRKGANSIELKVVNTWHNRMVGDVKAAGFGSAAGIDASATPARKHPERVTWYSMDFFHENEPLLPSGLLGPVRVMEQMESECQSWKSWTVTGVEYKNRDFSGITRTADDKAFFGVFNSAGVYWMAEPSDSDTTMAVRPVMAYKAQFQEGKRDIEAVALDRRTGDLYYAQERRSEIKDSVTFKGNTLYMMAAPDYDTEETVETFGADLLPNDNRTIEGLTWAGGDRFYIGREGGEGCVKGYEAAIFVYDLKKGITDVIDMSSLTKQIGGMYYDCSTRLLWVLDGDFDKVINVFRMTRKGPQPYKSYDISFIENAEGIYVERKKGRVWIASDETPSRLYRLDFKGL